MSKRSAIILVTFCTFLWSGLSSAEMSILGEWAGVDSDGDTAVFVFSADNSAEVKLEGVPLLSTKTMRNGRVAWFKDESRQPMLLDIVIYRGSEEKERIRMIARFIDAQTLLLQLSRDMKTRPAGFDLARDVFQIQLTRQ